MKDFNVNKEEKTEEISIKEARKEVTLINSQKYIPGLNMFELDMSTFGVKQIVPVSKDTEIVERKNMITGQKMVGFGTKTKTKYLIKDNCIYTQAINAKVASKKFEECLDKAILNENFSKKVGK